MTSSLLGLFLLVVYWQIDSVLTQKNQVLLLEAGMSDSLSAIHLLNYLKAQADLDIPDLQFYFTPAFFGNYGFTKGENHALTLGVTQRRPDSRGYIQLRSLAPLQPSIIQPNYLTVKTDWQVVLPGIQIADKIFPASIPSILLRSLARFSNFSQVNCPAST